VTRVLLIDDHPIVLQGCKNLLEGAGADDVDRAQSACEGFRIYRQRKPDLIVVDLAMRAGSLNGLSFLRRFRRVDERTPLLVLTMHRDPLVVSSAFELGANGYVLKDASAGEFVQAFKMTCEGGSYLSREFASDLEFRRVTARNVTFDGLTSREAQVLTLVAAGKPHSKIADKLNVSCSTVAKTCTLLKVKLGVHTRTDLIRTAIEHFSAVERKAMTGVFRRRKRRSIQL